MEFIQYQLPVTHNKSLNLSENVNPTMVEAEIQRQNTIIVRKEGYDKGTQVNLEHASIHTGS